MISSTPSSPSGRNSKKWALNYFVQGLVKTCSRPECREIWDWEIKAYVTRIGFPARGTDLVDIFDYAGPEVVGSVVEQNVFHKKWIDSLRAKPGV
jgi:hypothetical protein